MTGEVAFAPVERERITFVPHPLTITAAGDYEYFAAQGRHPLCYAIGEMVDNSLRATRANAPRPRDITVALVVSGSNPATARGLISIHDNGCGMNKQELNSWAVMNYSMEERGQAPQEPEAAGRGASAAVGRFLTGDISFFGVGSKNAAFFMGGSVKVTTKHADEAAVHELCLRAQELEQRYRDQQDVYVEEMVHRQPGDPSTLAPMEQPFSAAQQWVAAEAEAEAGPSFTRVVVGDLKPDVLAQIMDAKEGAAICQELAHLYHYYLHGERGNRGGASAGVPEGRLPNGEPYPNIMVQYQVDGRVVWSQRLVEVDDDMETRMLRAQRAELPFTLTVPDKGQVAGVLYYFPYENDHETVPQDPVTSFKPREESPFGAGGLTQAVPRATQAPPRGTQAVPRGTQALQRGTQAPRQLRAGGGAADELMDDEDEGALSWQAHPIFEAFWQGRLIPGARIDSLPFIESVRQKRSAQAKDVIPDEAFRRLRGALFFGPGFKVTRNKLLFRDNVQQILMTSAVPTERQMEAKFKAWLQRCHTTLDKSVRFEQLADSRTQAAVRSKMGEGTTAYERISDGAHVVSCGDVVRINAKPLVVGRVLHFTVPQVAKEEGCYANGRVTVELLPPELHGLGSEKTFSLRRLEAVLAEAEVEEHVNLQLMKVATTLRLEPMRFATGEVQEVAAGDSIPETTVTVLNGSGQRMTKAALGSERMVVTQRLWRLASPRGEAAEEPAAQPPAKRQRKGRKGRAKQDENVEPGAERGSAGGEGKPAAPEGVDLTGAELIVEYVNKTPDQECFKFKRLGGDALQRAGRYAVEYVASPTPPGQAPLRAVVELAVSAGAPTSLEVSGEGKVAAALRPFALGEELPPLKLSFSDAYGNAVALQPMASPPVCSVRVALPAAGGGLQPCKELEVRVQQEAVQDGMLLSGLQLLGSQEARHTGSGLQLFSGVDSSNPTARQAQARPSQAALPVAEVLLCFSLQADGGDLEPQVFPVQLRPGAPQSLRLLPGHPWKAKETPVQRHLLMDVDAGCAVVSLQHAEVLPDFSVQAFDAWGCATGPGEHLHFRLLVECPALAPAAKEFEFSPAGMATVSGLEGGAATPVGCTAELQLKLLPAPNTVGAEAAFAAAGDMEPLTCRVAVAPSTQPVALAILKDGVRLATIERADDDGTRVVARLEGQPAGEQIRGLELLLLDGSGEPAMQVTNGRVGLSWRNSHPKRTWEGQPLKLPSVTAPELVSEVKNEWVRFLPSDGPMLDICLEIASVAGDPTRWGVALVEQATSQSPDVHGAVQCGQPFALELEVLDCHNNRCGGTGGGGMLPQPVISVESEEGTPLSYNELEWEQGWVSQAGEQVYSVKMALSGHPGRVKISVSSAEQDPQQLAPDSLMLELHAGLPAALAVDGLASLDCGTRAVLPQLRVRLCDAAGNPTTSSDTFDVSINSSALASDGSGRAASVSVNGGNKTKMKKGTAVFKEVKVTAEEAGTYALRVQGASRKLALADAVLHLVMAPQNSVTGLEVVVPEPLAAEGYPAGSSAELFVAVATEDGVPLPPEVACTSLALRVTPPGGGKADAVVYRLPAAEDGAALLTEDGFYAFQLAEMAQAGTYSAVAEYTEGRQELLAGMSKRDAVARSSTAQFSVQPGQPVTVGLQAAGGRALPERIAVTNGADQRQRQLLRGLAAQLEDAHGNAAEAVGVRIRFGVRAAAAGAVPPRLQVVEGLAQWETDSQGRAFIGDLTIEQGSGKAPSGALECELVCEALGLYPSSALEHEVDEEGWATCWRCPLLFSDDAARYAALQQLNQQREELAARRAALSERLGAAQRGVEDAAREHQQVVAAMEQRQREAPSPLPETVKAAQRKLAQLQKQAEAQGDAEPAVVPAKYGRPRQATTAAIDHVLRSGDAGVVGVVAQLATIQDDTLARVAAACCRGVLGVVVVRDAPTRQRLVELLQAQRLPVPDMLSQTHAAPYRGRQADVPGFSGAGPTAQALTRAACAGSDPALPMPLPHMTALRRMKEDEGARVAGQGPGVDDWPQGLCGYLINLVRPVHHGHRASLLYGLLGATLVFETLEAASAYREFVVQKLKSGLSDIVTLDGQRISSRGIISGSSSFQVPASLDQADYCFACCASGAGGDAGAGAAAQQAAMEEWLDLLRQRAAADAAVAEAQAVADAAAADCGGQLEEVEAALGEVDAQLALGQLATSKSDGAPSTYKKKRGRRQQAELSPQGEEEEGQQQQQGKRRRRQAQ